MSRFGWSCLCQLVCVIVSLLALLGVYSVESGIWKFLIIHLVFFAGNLYGLFEANFRYGKKCARETTETTPPETKA